MYSYGPLHMAEQKQDDQLEHTYNSYVRIRDVALKTCRRRWTIGRSGKRGLGISVLAARHDDDDDDDDYLVEFLFYFIWEIRSMWNGLLISEAGHLMWKWHAPTLFYLHSGRGQCFLLPAPGYAITPCCYINEWKVLKISDTAYTVNTVLTILGDCQFLTNAIIGPRAPLTLWLRYPY